MAEYERLRTDLIEETVQEKDGHIPNKFTDIKKMDVIMQCDRTNIEFEREIESLRAHEELFNRPRLTYLVNNVYIPKLKAKSFASFLYAGESDDNYNNYRQFTNHNTLFNDLSRCKEEVILGIESSFDESAASLVNSYGKVIADNQITQWDQWRDNDGIDPKVSCERHEANIPKVVD